MTTAAVEAELPSSATPNRKVLEEKWGKSVIAAGYTVMPTVVLKYQQRLKLDALDVNLLMHLVSYWWHKDNLPHPGKTALALAVNVDPSTVRRRLKALEERGFIKRVARRSSNKGSQTNLYDLSGLIEALEPLAAEEHEEIRKRKARRMATLAGKKPPPGLTLVKA
jgi:predicted transcriptional regulator